MAVAIAYFVFERVDFRYDGCFIKSLFKFLAKKQYLKVHKLVFTNLNTIEWNRLPAYENTLHVNEKKIHIGLNIQYVY